MKKKSINSEKESLNTAAVDFNNDLQQKLIEGKKESKNFWGIVLKTLVSFSLLFYLGSKLNWQKFFSYCQSIDLLFLGFAFLFCALQTILSSLRWKLLLFALNIPIRGWTAFELAMIGKFFNAALPGGTSGDFVRIYYAMELFPRNKTAVSVSILFDRLIEGVVLLVLGSSFGLLFYRQLNDQPFLQKAVFFLLGLTLLTLLFLATLPMLLKFGIKLSQRYLGKWKRVEQVLTDIVHVLDVFKYCYGRILAACILSIGVHLSAILMFVFVSASLHMHLPLWLLAVVMVEITLIVSLPISISGLGVREGAVVLLFGSYGINPELALGFSLLSFSVGILWSLIGGLFFLTWKKNKKNSVSLPT
ncbi:hypothetical protein A7K73_09925 [Candidatus Methylacidiphilum fumarolicum]|uniref:Uncharacterized conserved membrane protein n=1 Tax=Methylacidiphilum fumariolicum (strain SolV) TaxID=1156937 RepID=I0JW17_METFB|nr:lysylphosphatidylglycerol synthase transmembrane domain-containing protein [Candidatus Methylacidiphilum fumarolicum]TFE66809.1 hypothetical protein A7K73_09925 [Candidatus Methylacidiphilum fumarolicum]TFE77647.1 hypothetical protein A7D33_03840 [Candidatus Methylacidiphilum fumarolicum]CCG91436.1 Uncharacterized conserved membrane protein [Methylacidiphilum fumariolicum SolV]